MISILLLNSLLAGCVSLAVAGVSARFARRASTRFVLWSLAFAAAVVLPPLSLLLPPVAAVADAAAPAAGTGAVMRIVVAVWALCSAAAIGRLILALRRARQLVQGARFEERIETLAARVGAELNNARPFRTCISPHVRSPQFIGLGRPFIALPPSAESLGDDALRAVLLHEIAHVRRHDDWLIAAEQLAKALFFFNAALHAIGRRLAVERELACDEIATRHCAPADYAEMLLRVASDTRAALALALGATALQRRVSALLDPRPQRRGRDWLAVAVAACATIAATSACLPYAARRTVLTFAAAPAHAAEAVLAETPSVQQDNSDPLAQAAERFVSGRSRLGLGQYEAAIAELSHSYEAGYETFASAYNLAVAYERLGDAASAREWRRIAAREPGWTYTQ